jgi:hypothetical protein
VCGRKIGKQKDTLEAVRERGLRVSAGAVAGEA